MAEGVTTTMTLSQAGADMICKYEGFRANAYLCPANYWTIGYGHLIKRGDGLMRKVLTKQEAKDLFNEDAKVFVDGVNRVVNTKLTQGQFDALVSFAFNLGVGALEKSTLLKHVNARKFALAEKEFGKWVNAAGKKLDGLVARRAEEAAIFSKGE